jgi:predicted SnoaL-like aldol condensation-catalyzing enzyme
MSKGDLVRTFTEQFKNRANFDIVDELCTENFVHHIPIPDLPPGRDGMKAVGHVVTGALHDIAVSIEIVLTDGDYIANRNNARGVRADSGEAINWVEHEIWRTENGRLAEQWSVADGLDVG